MEKAPWDKMEVQVLGCWWEEPEECGRKMASTTTPSVRAAETVRALATRGRAPPRRRAWDPYPSV